MTASINYDEIHRHVQAELHALQTEKARLLEQRQIIERRLGAVHLREAKLQRVIESLADLFSVDDSRRAAHPATAGDAATLIADGTPAGGEPTAEREFETTLAAVPVDAADRGANDAVPNNVETTFSDGETTSSPITTELIGLADNAEDLLQPALESESDNAETTVTCASTTHVVSLNERTVRRVADFAARDFFERLPHITNTHPVHILAAKLLDYFGYGLKLHEIAGLIEQLGYKHNSRNFTDSVHSALKNKRKTTGEFRFNAAKSVWELAHWQTADLSSDKASRRATDAASAENAAVNAAPTTLLTRQVETAIAEQLSKAKTDQSHSPARQSATGTGKKPISAGTGKDTIRAIKVYKSVP